jgi:hypothetical protein
MAMLNYQRVFFLVKEPIDPIGLIPPDLLDPVPGESIFSRISRGRGGAGSAPH